MKVGAFGELAIFRGKFLLRSRDEPESDVARVGAGVFGGLRVLQDGVAGRFADERRTAFTGIEVVVQEMVEAGIDQCSAFAIRLESDGDVERCAGQLAFSGRDYART